MRPRRASRDDGHHGCSTIPPRRRAGTPRSETRRASRGCGRRCAWSSCDGFDPVGFLRAELGSAADDGLAASVTGRDREQRELVDEPRHLGGRHRRTDEIGGAQLHVPRGLCADHPPVVDGDPRAHALEHVQQARPTRIEPDSVHRDGGSRHDRCADVETAQPTICRPGCPVPQAGGSRPARP